MFTGKCMCIADTKCPYFGETKSLHKIKTNQHESYFDFKLDAENQYQEETQTFNQYNYIYIYIYIYAITKIYQYHLNLDK